MASLPIRPAATVLALRDAPGGLEVLLVQRADQLAFHGGAWVFPGGRVDAADLSSDGELAAAQRAAVRESYEEARLTLQVAALTPFSHWTTPEGRPRRFATWFFATQVPEGCECVVDGGEIHAHRWLTPAQALTLQAAGQLELPPPTFVSLAVLQPYRWVGQVLDAARARTPPVFVPRPHQTSEGVVSLYQGDAAYESGQLAAAGPRHRLNMRQSGYQYECTLP